MKPLLKLLKDCDFYGKPITLNMKGNQRLNSVIGGIMSVIYSIICIIIFSINFTTFISYDSPLITVSSNFRNQSILESISNTQLFFANFFIKLNQIKQEINFLNANPFFQNNYCINIQKKNSKFLTVKEDLRNFSSCNHISIYKNITQSRSFKTINESNNDFVNCLDLTTLKNITLGGDIIQSDLQKISTIYLKYNKYM